MVVAGLVDESYRGPVLVAATVREKDDPGPQLCVGPIGVCLPPSCGGPLIENRDWDAVAHESRAGVRFGTYVLEGSFDGARFTLATPAELVTEPGCRGWTTMSTSLRSVPRVCCIGRSSRTTRG